MVETIVQGLTTALDSIFSSIGQWLAQHGYQTIFILLIAWVLSKFGAQLISQALRYTIRPDLYPTKADREKRLKTLNSLIGTTVRVAVYLVAGVMLINELGVNTGPLLASAGIIGVALGFGAQSFIKDLVSGVFIIIENQYRVGDIVELGGVGGTVEHVTIRTTVIRDLDGNLHHIPNGTIAVTTNKTIGFSRINEDIVVALNTDLDRLEHVVNHVGQELAAAAEFKHAILESPHFASFKGFAPNGVVIKILGKTTAADQWKVRSELYKRLKLAFDKNDIAIASQPAPVVQSKK